jgi:hypothetical protein
MRLQSVYAFADMTDESADGQAAEYRAEVYAAQHDAPLVMREDRELHSSFYFEAN